MQLRILILAAIMALAAAKPYKKTTGGYDRRSDSPQVQSHALAYEHHNAENVETNQGRKTAQPARPHSGSEQSGEPASEQRFGSGRYSGPKDANRPSGRGYGDNFQPPIGASQGDNFQRPVGEGYGDNFQRPTGAGHGDNFQRPTGAGHGDNFQRPTGAGHGDNFQRPVGGGYGANFQSHVPAHENFNAEHFNTNQGRKTAQPARSYSGSEQSGEHFSEERFGSGRYSGPKDVNRPYGRGYGDNFQPPIGASHGDNFQRPVGGGYGDNFQRPVGGGYGGNFPGPVGGGYGGNFPGPFSPEDSGNFMRTTGGGYGESAQRPFRTGYAGNMYNPVSGGYADSFQQPSGGSYRQIPSGQNSNFEAEEFGGSVQVNRPQRIGEKKGSQPTQTYHPRY